MRKRIMSILAILLTLFYVVSVNLYVYNVYAYEDATVLNDKIIKVVLPTDVNFLIDPYEVLEEGTMIISSDFNIINKSSVPIKVDMSFELFTENDIPLNIKSERHTVNSNSGDKDIWFAAVFSKDIEHTITNKREITFDKGVYLIDEMKDTKEEEIAATVSGAAIVLNSDESNRRIDTVSGVAISLINEDSGNNITSEIRSKEHAEAISGSAIISSIVYEDTERVYAGFGDVDKLTEKSSNVLVINNEFNKYTFVLDKAKTYYFYDGKVVTGEVAENNAGVIAFRFIGELNPNVNWRNVNLKVSAVYSIEEISDSEINESEINNLEIYNSYTNDIYTNEIDINKNGAEEYINNEDLGLYQRLDIPITFDGNHNNVLFYNKDENNESD